MEIKILMNLTLSIQMFIAGRQLTDFNKWFPIMRHLRLYQNQFVDPMCIEKHFVNLVHLEICNKEDRCNHMIFDEHNIRAVLHLNPQLQTIKIGSGWDVDFYCEHWENIYRFIEATKGIDPITELVCLPGLIGLKN